MTRLVGIAALLLVGLGLRLGPLVNNPLHQDEALYGFWGRLISTGRDPWLLTVPVDKPPLAPYLFAGSQMAFGVSEFSLRLPGLAASLLAVPLTYALARRLYGGGPRHRYRGLVAAAVMALTPYPVLFGAVALTDALLVLWWLAACYAAAGGRWGWAGVLLGLALATKQPALALAPLALMLGLGNNGGRAPGRFVLGLGVVVGLILGWDGIRIASMDGAGRGFWTQGVESYGGLRLIWSTELGPRLADWTRLSGYLLGWPVLGLLFLAGVAVTLGYDFFRERGTRAAWVDLTLITFALFYLLMHLVLAFPTWDRYLLPLVPVLALLLERVVVLLSRWANRFSGDVKARGALYTTLILGVLLSSTGVLAARGRIPVGGDHGAYQGIERVVDFLRGLPVGTVLYDRWLSWHYDFYLFDAYLYRAGFPSPRWLAADARALYDGRPRYVVVPGWESSARLARALSQVGLALSPALTTRRQDGTLSFVVYEIGELGGGK